MTALYIKKAKITSVGYMEVEYVETVTTDEKDDAPVLNEVSKKCNYEPHADLKATFEKLVPHLVALCELMPDIDLTEAQEQHLMLKFSVTGFTIGGEGEHEGVTLIGRKHLAHNRVLNLVTPFTKWEDEHNGYGESWELKMLVRACQTEVEEYLGGKRQPAAQLELEFENAQ